MNQYAPQPSPAKNINYPEIQSGVLENGVTVLCVTDRYLPKVSVRVIFPIGKAHDPFRYLGRLQLTVDMLKEGTARYSSQSLASYLDMMALELDFEVATEHSFVSITGLKNQLEPAVGLLAELLQKPTFPDQELEKVKIRWKGHLISQRSDPGFLANERFLGEIFGGHPYSKATISMAELEAIQRENLEDGLKNLLDQTCYLLFTGAVDIEEAMELARAHFGSLVPNLSSRPGIELELPKRKRTVALVCRPHSTQTQVAVGIRTIPRSDGRFLAFRLANQVFGGGASSRLFLNLREDKGYTYGAYSAIRSHHYGGLQVAAASVKTEAALSSVEEILKEVELMSTRIPSEDELRRSKAELAGSFIRRTETPYSVGTLEISRRLMSLPEEYYQTYIPKLQSFTNQEIQAVSKELLLADDMSIVVVSDRKAVEHDLHSLGDLKVYDSEGNRSD